MAYDENLANQVRAALENIPGVEEKKMFRGVTFMVNDKMCICISGARLMCRVGEALQQQLVETPGYIEVIMRGAVMKDFVYAEHSAFKSKKQFDELVSNCLAFNKLAKSSKTRKPA